jgi:hypothetical protein
MSATPAPAFSVAAQRDGKPATTAIVVHIAGPPIALQTAVVIRFAAGDTTTECSGTVIFADPLGALPAAAIDDDTPNLSTPVYALRTRAVQAAVELDFRQRGVPHVSDAIVDFFAMIRDVDHLALPDRLAALAVASVLFAPGTTDVPSLTALLHSFVDRTMTATDDASTAQARDFANLFFVGAGFARANLDTAAICMRLHMERHAIDLDLRR